MKKLLIILLLFSSTLHAQITPDKYKHSAAGFFISSGVSVAGICTKTEISPTIPSLITASVAFGKEFHDSMNGGHFSLSDAGFTIASGIITELVIRTIFNKKRKKRQRRNDPYDWDNDPLLTSN